MAITLLDNETPESPTSIVSSGNVDTPVSGINNLKDPYEGRSLLQKKLIQDDIKLARDTIKWRQGERKKLDHNALNFEKWLPEVPKEHRVRSLIQGVMDAEMDMNPASVTSYETARVMLDRQVFGGDGSADDDAIFMKIQGRAKETKEKLEFYGKLEDEATLSALMGDDPYLKRLNPKFLFDPVFKKEKARSLQVWKDTISGIEEEYGDILPDVRKLWKMVDQDKPDLYKVADIIFKMDDDELDSAARILGKLQELQGSISSDRGVLGNIGEQSGRDKERIGSGLKGAAIGFFSKVAEGLLIEGEEITGLDNSQAIEGEQGRQENLDRSERFLAEIRRFRDQRDPIVKASKEGSFLGHVEGAVYAIPGVGMTIAASAIPIIGQANTISMLKQSAEDGYYLRALDATGDRNLSRKLAEEVSLPIVALQYLPERFGIGAITRKLPGLNKVLGKLPSAMQGRFARILAGTTARGVAETTTEEIQAILTEFGNDILNGLKEDIPEADWDAHWANFGGRNLETFLSIAPYSGLSAARHDSGLGKAVEVGKKASRDQLLASGYKSEDVDAFQSAETPLAQRSSFNKMLSNQDPKTEEAKQAVGRVIENRKATIAAHRKLLEAGTILGVRMTKDSSSYEVYDTESGEAVTTVETPAEASQIVYGAIGARDRAIQNHVDALTSKLQAARMIVDETGVTQEIEDTKWLTTEEAGRIFAGSDESIAEEVELLEQAEGGSGEVSRAVFDTVSGVNIPAGTHGRIKEVTKLFKGSSISTLIHEKSHSVRRKLMANGEFTNAEQIAFFRKLNEVLKGKKTRKTKDGRETALEFQGFDGDKVTEKALDEAWAYFSEVMLLKSKNGKKSTMRELLNTNLSAMVGDGTPGASKFKAFIRAMRDWLGLNLGRAAAIDKALRDGKLDAAEMEKFRAAVMGETIQGQFENEVIETHKENFVPTENIPFSIGSTEVTPNAETRTFPTKDGGVVGPATFSISAFHGTPHKVGRFSTDRIGTGEGAQVYGWGLYFAENRAVADTYRFVKENDDPTKWTFDGQPYDGSNPRHAAAISTGNGAITASQAVANLQALIKHQSSPSYVKQLEETITALEAGDIPKVGKKGNLYTVNLKVEPEELLDWDKPLSEQSEVVREALAKFNEDFRETSDEYDANELGQQTYQRMVSMAGLDAGQRAALIASADLSQIGIKGIRYLDGNSRADGEGSYNYVIFNEADIEILEENGQPVNLSEGMKAAFSISPAQDGLASTGIGGAAFSISSDRNLAAIHNLTEDNLLFSVKELGMIPPPSIAIVRTDLSEFDGFGEISLIAPPSRIDPAKSTKNRAFNADAYTPRFPRLAYKTDRKAFNKAELDLAPIAEKLGMSGGEVNLPDLSSDGLDILQDDIFIMGAYLDSKGKPIKPILTDEIAVSPTLKKLAKGKTQYELAQDPKFQTAALQEVEKQIAGVKLEKLRQRIKESSIKDDGTLSLSKLDEMARLAVRSNRPRATDRIATREKLRKAIAGKSWDKGHGAFKEWIKENYSDLISEKVIPNGFNNAGNKKFLPFTLQNIIRLMSKDIKAGETFNYGIGTLRGASTKEFKSLQNIRDSRDLIVSEQEMERLKEQTSDQFDDIINRLSPFLAYQNRNQFVNSDSVAMALTDLAKGRRNALADSFSNLPAELESEVRSFLKKLSEMPTSYFEVKITDGVPLSDFSAAVIPKGTGKEVVDILKGAGLKISYYQKGENESRRSVIKEAANRSSLSFSISPAQDGFYSQLRTVLDSKIQGKQATPEQIKAIIDPSRGSGVKAEEIKWSGIEAEIDRLASENGGKVPKAALLEYLRDEGRTKFEEVVMGGDLSYEEWYKRHDIEGTGLDEETARRMYQDESLPSSATKFGQYQLPGGENYREVVLSMPPKNGHRYDKMDIASIRKDLSDRLKDAKISLDTTSGRSGVEYESIEIREWGNDKYLTSEDIGDKGLRSDFDEFVRRAKSNQKAPLDDRGKIGNSAYTSSHFTDIPNYVAHMRLNERTDAEGNEGLFIEEIQSDRHQEGRKEGYRNNPNDLSRPFEISDFDLSIPDAPGKIPDAPFRTSWPLAMFKRALRDAVESGKEWIGWTTGQTQNKRYDLSQSVDKIVVSTYPDYDDNKSRRSVNVYMSGETTTLFLDDNGIVVATGNNANLGKVVGEPLDEVLGKDVAQRIMDIPQDAYSLQTLAGDDLKVGGSGMKGFYDQILPKEVQKYVKQWGGKVEQSKVLEDTPIWRMDITPEMRESIAKTGQVSFSLGQSAMVNDVISDVTSRVRDPEARADIFENIILNVDQLRRDTDKPIFGGTVTQKAIVDPREMKSLKKEAGMREALRYDELEMALDSEMRTLGSDLPVSVRDMPAHSVLIDGGYKLTTKKKAVKDGRMSETDGDFDGSDGLHPSIFGGDTMPDVAAQALAGEQVNGQNLLNEGTAQELFEVLANEWAEVQRNREMNKDAKAAIVKAKKQAKAESNAWLQERIAEQKRDYNPMARLRRSLAMLDAIMMALPIELRGKIGGFVQISKLNTEEKRLEFLKDRLDKIDNVVESWVKNNLLKDITKVRGQAKATRKGGKKPKGKLGAEGHRFFDRVENVADLSKEDIEKEEAYLFTEIAKPDGDGARSRIDLAEDLQILQVFGGLNRKNAQELAAASRLAHETYRTKRNQWRVLEENRLGQLKVLVEETIDALGNPDIAAIQEGNEVESDRKEAIKALKSVDWTILSFSEVMERLFGRDHPLAARWSKAVRQAMGARTTAITQGHRRWKKATEEATGKKGRAAQLEVWEMQTKQTIKAAPMKDEKTTVKVPIKTFLQSESRKSLGLTKEEEIDIQDQIDNLKKGSQKKYILIERVKVVPEREANFTDSQAIYLTMLFAQDGYKDTMRKHGFGETFQTQLEEGMSDAAKSIREHLKEEYAENYEPLRKIFARMFGMDLPQIKGYTPGKFYSQGDDLTMDVTGSGFVEGGLMTGFLADRKSHSAEPRIESAFSVYFAHLNQTEHWKALAEVSREIRGVFGNPKVKKALKAKNERAAFALGEWLKAIDGNGFNNPKSNKVFEWLISTQAKLALAWKVSTIAKNFFGASVNAGFKVPLGDFIKGYGRLMNGKIDFRAMMDSELIQQRLDGGFSPEARAAINEDLGGKPTRGNQFVMMGMDVIGKADALGTAMGAAITYDYHYRMLLKEMGPEQAHDLAMDEAAEAIARTAQPVNVTDRSLMELQLTGLGKIAFIFASEARQKSAMWTQAWARTLTGKADKRDYRVLVMTHFVVAPLMHGITSALRDARNDDDDELFDEKNWGAGGWIRSVLTGPISGLPLLREIGDGFNSDDSGPLSRISNAGSSSIDLLQAIFGDEDPKKEEIEWYERKITSVLQAFGATSAVSSSVFDQMFDFIDNIGGKD